MENRARVHPQQFAALLAAPGAARYQHFIGRAADSQQVWGLRNDAGWISYGAEDGAPCFAVWPHADYAAACAGGEWGDCTPAAIDVHAFVGDWLPSMESGKVPLAVFPTPSGNGVVVSAGDLRAHLLDELSNYE